MELFEPNKGLLLSENFKCFQWLIEEESKGG